MNKNAPNTQHSVALIGTGNICQGYHVPCLLSTNSKIRYAVDPDANALQKLRSAVSGVQTFPDISELPGDVDCAVVCSPTALHAEHVRVLCENRIHVLCEKPLATASCDAERLVHIAKENGVVLQAGYYRRFHPSAQRVRDLLYNGELGVPTKCLVLAGHAYGSMDLSYSMMDKVLSGGGGVLLDYGVHVIDRLLSWFGAVSLFSYADDSEGGIEANAIVTLYGLLNTIRIPITILLSRTNNLGFSISIDFENGTIVSYLEIGDELKLLSPAISVLGKEIRPSTTIAVGERRQALDYFRAQWAEFLMRIESQTESVSSLQDAVKTTALVEQCYKNRQKLNLPWEILEQES